MQNILLKQFIAKAPPKRPLIANLYPEEATRSLNDIEDRSVAFDIAAIISTNSMTEVPMISEYGTYDFCKTNLIMTTIIAQTKTEMSPGKGIT